MPETKYFDPQPKKRVTSRAREVISDAKKAQKSTTKYFHRPEKMTCLICAQADVLFFCRACGMDHVSTATTRPTIIVHAIESIFVRQSQMPIFRLHWVSMSAKRSPPRSILRLPSHLNPRAGPRLTDMPVDFAVCKKSCKDLVLGGVSTGYSAMDRIVLEGARKYHYSNHQTYASRSIPSIAQHWDEQSDVAPYPIIRPSCYYDSKRRRYDGDEMRQIVELSRSYTQG